jgi:hypothetical protein
LDRKLPLGPTDEISQVSDKEKIIYTSSYCFNDSSLLFLSYINDLPTALDQRCVLFADYYATIIVRSTNKNYLERIANLHLRKVVTWLENNKI